MCTICNGNNIVIKKKIRVLMVINLLLSTSQSFCQNQGDLILSFSFGLLTKGGISLKYFVEDGVALELCGGAMPHVYNYGIYLNFYPELKSERAYYVVGLARFGGFSYLPYDTEEIFDANPDTLLQRGVSLTGVRFGMGFEKVKEKRDANGKLFYNNYYGAFGATYSFKEEIRFLNKENQAILKEPHKKRRWSMFVEGGYGAVFK